MAENATSTRTVSFERLSCSELDGADYAVEYLIDQSLVAGEPLVAFGPSKALKTSLIVDAAISLAAARPFLGKFAVERATRVGVMSGESGLATLQETSRRIAAAKGVHLPSLLNLVWSPNVPRFDRHEHLEALRRFLLDDELEVLVIDPAYLCMPSGDAGNMMAQGELLAAVTNVCRESGVTLMLVHHARKNATAQPGQPLTLADLAWAGFDAFARQWWAISRREDYAVGTGNHRLWLSMGGSAGHSSLWGVDVAEGVRTPSRSRTWRVTLADEPTARAADKSRKTQRRQAVQQAESAQQSVAARERVIEALKKAGKPLTQSDLSEALAMSKGRVRTLLEGLKNDGAITPADVLKESNGRTYPGFQLADSTSSP